MSYTIDSKYKYFHSTVQRAEDRGQKFHFCRLQFDVTSSLISLLLNNNNNNNKNNNNNIYNAQNSIKCSNAHDKTKSGIKRLKT